jgi:hypothetical protein
MEITIDTLRTFVLNSPSLASHIQKAAKARLTVVDETDERHEPGLLSLLAACHRLKIQSSEELERSLHSARGADRFFEKIYDIAWSENSYRMETKVITSTPILEVSLTSWHKRE